jgi:ubiquinone/menaquinone biosynthesis C-methylase UbiE
MSRWKFYEKSFLNNINKNSKFLLISGSEYEIKILQNLGFSCFSVTYHDESDKEILKKYGFKVNINLFKSDIRNLQFDNKSYDYVVTNATIHHVDQPHKAITEMYRVANKGVLIIESNDSLTMRIACKFKFAETFEVSSINHEKNSGGLLDTGIPNYVYRWTEREILKLLNSYDPSNVNYIKFEYSNDLENLKSKKFFSLIVLFAKIYFFIFKKQQNCISIFIDKSKIRSRFY